MKKFGKRLAIAAVGMIMCFVLASCSSNDVVYPVTLDGTEVIVGETTLSALYDAGFTVMALNTQTHIGSTELESTYELDADSYYTALYVQKGDVRMASIALVTDKSAIPASEAVIATVNISAEQKHSLDTATFAGVSVADLTAEKFLELVAGSTLRDDNKSAYISGNKYLVRAYYENGVPISLEMKRNYDVDYSS